MSTKIMIQLHKKYDKPTKNDFDNAIADLFNKASNNVSELAADGKNPSCDFDFWRGPKVGTIFEKLSDNTTYRFAVKLLEARDRWDDRERVKNTFSDNAASYEGETVKAIDRFKGNVEFAAVASVGFDALMEGDLSKTIDFTMSSYMIDQFTQFSDTDEGDPSDDEVPNQPRAAKRVKLDKTGVTNGDVGFEPTLVAGTAKLAIGGDASESMKGAKQNNMSGTGDFDAFLAQMAMEDQAQLDEEDMMEMDGN